MKILDAGNIMVLGHPYLMISREDRTSLEDLIQRNPALIRHASLGAQVAWASKCGPNVRYIGAVEVAHSMAVADVLGGHGDESCILQASEDWDPIIYKMAREELTPDALKAATDDLGLQVRTVLADARAPVDPVLPDLPDVIPKPPKGHSSAWVPWAIFCVGALGLLCVLVAHARS